MNIIVNGDALEVASKYTPADLVNLLQMQNDKIAMEVNLEIIPRSQYPTFEFSEGDKIEIVRAIGGG